MRAVFDFYTEGRIRLDAPLIDLTKKEVYLMAKKTKVPIRLTYSCEAGTDPVCGVCASCLDRAALTIR
jgi:7-cyano-7-deazaguanine synthase